MLVKVYKITYIKEECATQYDLFTTHVANNYADIKNWLRSNAEKWVEMIGACPYNVKVSYNKDGYGSIWRDFNAIFEIKTH